MSCLVDSQPRRLPRRPPRLVPPNLFKLLLRLVLAELEHRALEPAAITQVDAFDDSALIVSFAGRPELTDELLDGDHAGRLVDRKAESRSRVVPRLVFEAHEMDPGVLLREDVGGCSIVVEGDVCAI